MDSSTDNVYHFDPTEDQVTARGEIETVEITASENEKPGKAKPFFVGTSWHARLIAPAVLFLAVFGIALGGLIIASQGKLTIGETSKNLEDLDKNVMSRIQQQFELQWAKEQAKMEARMNETKLMSQSLVSVLESHVNRTINMIVRTANDREVLYNSTHMELENEMIAQVRKLQTTLEAKINRSADDFRNMIEESAMNMSEVQGKLEEMRDERKKFKEALEQNISQLSGENDKLENDVKAGLAQCNARIEALKDNMSWYRATNGFVYKVFKDQKNYTEARQSCKDNDARLVSEGMRNSKTRGELVNLMKLSGTDIWIGANDIVREGTFVWEDGITMNAADIDWHVGEPSNGMGSGEDCVHYYEPFDWEANDRKCNVRTQYMCEKI